MTMKSSKKACRQSELHTGHFCELESQQEWDTIRQITDKPSVKCENCGAEVNSSRNVCMPTEL
jgi:predicted nucleic acid-binding Zn ribbon protein